MSNRKRARMSLSNCVHCSNSDSLDEVIAIVDPKIHSTQLIDQDEMQFNLDQFIIHTKHGHCSLEDGLIEKGDQVFVCGLIYKLIDTNSTNSLPAHLIGPISEWWFAGFDGGNDLLVGIQSNYATYLLRRPHPTYKNQFQRLHSKMYVTKCVIECLSQNPFVNFDELMLTIEHRYVNFDYELFLGSLQFVLRQIYNYDQYADQDDIKLCNTLAYQTLQRLSGTSVLLNDPKNIFRDNTTKCLIRKHNFTGHINSPASEKLFTSIYKDIVDHMRNTSKSNELDITKSKQQWIPGEFVQFEMDHKICYGKIIQTIESHTSHINLLCPGNETMLGEASLKNYLYFTKMCFNTNENITMIPIEVQVGTSFDNIIHSPENGFICTMLYDQENGSFETLPIQEEPAICFGCKLKEYYIPILKQNKLNCYEVAYREMYIRQGDFVCFDAQLDIPIYDYYKTNNEFEYHSYDEQLYPEKYRKEFSKDHNKGHYHLTDLAKCLYIGLIEEIIPNNGDINVRISLFYRPQNVLPDYDKFLQSDLNLVYWSNRTFELDVRCIRSKCSLVYSDSLDCDIYTEPKLFYFNLCYDHINQTLYEPSVELKRRFAFNQTMNNQQQYRRRQLRILDIFSGCGGLSYGFKQMASTMCAIENDQSAAESFRRNYQSALVLNSDANVILDQLINGTDHFITGNLPKKGSFDFIIGGPPCQGFSGMNRFSSSEYSMFKSSMIACFLNYVEYYQPNYVLLENVRNLALYKDSLILKIICSFLIRLGYQIRTTIIQAGEYGVPQNRRRLFIMAARMSVMLPDFPSPTHVFAGKHCNCSIKVDGKIIGKVRNKSNGIFRMISIEDAIRDLPTLVNFDDKKVEYVSDQTKILHYQRIMRKHSSNLLQDHHCKQLNELNLERIRRIPHFPGSDWRDLPNIEIKLNNGIQLKKLEYLYVDSQNRSRRGVCSCITKGKCVAKDRQENTLIPWCLVHTANRRNHWPGLYGRLVWKGYFSTIVTNPDPISIQGKVIHPEQDRVLSVREIARSQGFPDHFILCGNVDEKYRQIGNAVPPIISTCIAHQIFKSID